MFIYQQFCFFNLQRSFSTLVKRNSWTPSFNYSTHKIASRYRSVGSIFNLGELSNNFNPADQDTLDNRSIVEYLETVSTYVQNVSKHTYPLCKELTPIPHDILDDTKNNSKNILSLPFLKKSSKKRSLKGVDEQGKAEHTERSIESAGTRKPIMVLFIGIVHYFNINIYVIQGLIQFYSSYIEY